MVAAGRPRLFHGPSRNDKGHPVTSRNDDESASRYAGKGRVRALRRAGVGARSRDSTCTVVAGRTAARSPDRRRSSWFGQCVASSHLDRTKDGRAVVPMARDDVPWWSRISSRQKAIAQPMPDRSAQCFRKLRGRERLSLPIGPAPVPSLRVEEARSARWFRRGVQSGSGASA